MACNQADIKAFGLQNNWCPYFLARYSVGLLAVQDVPRPASAD
jgi:hypothetical protein